jgi:TatD DNase family protein
VIDSHCHLDLPAFESDWQAVVSRAARSGVTRLLIPGTTSASFKQQFAIQSQCSDTLPIDVALGLHPYFLNIETTPLSAQLSILEQYVASHRHQIVALGEIGLDGHISLDFTLQLRAFEQQLLMAMQFSLPVILHHRKSHHHIFSSLKKVGYAGHGVIHAFSGSIEVAMQYIERGFYIGVGGTITYERAHKTRETVRYLYKHHPCSLLLETDSPDMPMMGRQGKRNEPANISDVVDVLAHLVGSSKAAIIDTTNENYHHCFLR